MAYKEMSDLVIEGARIIYRNFAGVESAFNARGNRNFCLVIEDQELADKLKEDGWNVKIREPREEGEEVLNYIPVSVRFDNIPPKIFTVTEKNLILHNESTVASLDYADIQHIDITVSPYQWELPSGKSGVKAYVKTMYVTIKEDQFADKYSNLEYQGPY